MKIKNVIGSGVAVMKAQLFNKKIPLSVNFSITNRCNFKCRYCDIWKRDKEEMTTSEIFSLIDELAKLGTQRINFFGGEPLLREDIGKIVNYSKKKGIFISMSSNGSLISEKIDELRNVDQLLLSFDGPKRIHDKQRQKGSYEKLMEGIKNSKREGIPIYTMTVLTKNNIKAIDFILEKARELEVYAYFQLLTCDGEMKKDMLPLMASQKEYKEVIKRLIEYKKKGEPIANSLSYLEHLSQWPDYRIPYYTNNWPKDKKPKCWAGKLFCNIESNGDVYPCLYGINKIKPLNILKDGVSKSFNKLDECINKNCWCYFNLESNLLFSHDLNSVVNTLGTMR